MVRQQHNIVDFKTFEAEITEPKGITEITPLSEQDIKDIFLEMSDLGYSIKIDKYTQHYRYVNITKKMENSFGFMDNNDIDGYYNLTPINKEISSLFGPLEEAQARLKSMGYISLLKFEFHFDLQIDLSIRINIQPIDYFYNKE